ncbi:hypothetical protein ACLI4R_18035 [Natrialbaceae archaeon A-chndr2]
MAELVDVQGTVIGVGLLVAVALLAVGSFLSETVLGVDTLTLAFWVLAGTFAVISVLHAWVGQYNFAWAHGGAAFGWGLVLLGSSGFQVFLGVVLLVLSGAYIALLSRRVTRGGPSE